MHDDFISEWGRTISSMTTKDGWRSSLRLLIAPLVLVALARGLILAAPALAQQAAPVSVQVSMAQIHATVGDPIVLTITIHAVAGAKVNTNGIENQFGIFETLSSDPPVTQHTAGATVLRLRYHVAAYQTGALQFPALTIPYTFNSKPGTVQSRPLSFTIASVIPPGDAAVTIRGLKPQLDVQATAAPLPIRAILVGVAATLLVLLLALLLRRLLARRRQPLLPVTVPAPSPEEEARAELNRIADAGLLASHNYTTHYARLAGCIRRYVAERYGFPASALTTKELEERMVQSGVGRWRARLVTGLLSECDAVHYARYLPAPARAEADLQMAYEIVDLSWSQETRPEETWQEAGIR